MAFITIFILLQTNATAFPWSHLFGQKIEVPKVTEVPKRSAEIDTQTSAPVGLNAVETGNVIRGDDSGQRLRDELAHPAQVIRNADKTPIRSGKHLPSAAEMHAPSDQLFNGVHGRGAVGRNSKDTRANEASYKIEKALWPTAKGILAGHEEDRYAGIRKEIEALSKKLGPLPTLTAISTESGVQNNEEKETSEHNIVHAKQHTLLARGIEDAIAGLMNVYKALRTQESTKMDLEVSNSSHLRERPKNMHDEASGAKMFGSEGDSDSLLSNNAHENATRVHKGIPKADMNGEDEHMVTEASVTALAVLAGVVFVTAMGIMAMGYFHSRGETPAQTQPLYPPRGPSFV